MGWSDSIQGYLSAGKDESHGHFNDQFGGRLTPFLDAAKAAGHDIEIFSGYRSPEHQAQLYSDALLKYGSEAEARRWVAPPGRSQHNHGNAADLRYPTDEARQWAHENSANFGLNFRMGHEPWHIESNPDYEEPTPITVEGDKSLLTRNGETVVEPSSPTAMFSSYMLSDQPSGTSMPVSDAVETSQTAQEQGRAASENADKSIAAADEARQDDPEWEPRKTPTQDPLSQKLHAQQSNVMNHGARNFFSSLSPQQRMVEQQAYITAKRYKGENRSIDQWFEQDRFMSYLNGFAQKDPQTLGNLSQEQSQILERAVTHFRGLDRNNLMGLS